MGFSHLGVGALMVPHWGGAIVIPPPAGFTWIPPFTVYQAGSTFNAGSFDVSDYAPTGKAYYVNGTSGNDGNNGLTPGTALKKVITAVGKADIDVMYIAPGIYDRSLGWAGTAIARNVAVYPTPGLPGTVVLTNHAAGLVWVLDGVLTHTYKVTRSSVTNVLDVSQVDANGDYAQLTKQASAADVEANPGSWYMDGTNVLWVRTSDDRAPDADIWPLIDNNIRSTGNTILYVENITLVGGSGGCIWHRNGGAGQTPKLYLKNVTMGYSNTNGLTVEGVSECYLQNCVSKQNEADGFNYHVLNSVIPLAAEINCTGRHNGAVGDNDNGSSIHDAGSVIRIGGLYHHNLGQNVIDIDTAKSWNLGCTSHTSQATPGAANVNFQVTGTMWLDHCTSYGSTYDLAAALASDTIYTRSLTTDGNNSGSGIITTY